MTQSTPDRVTGPVSRAPRLPVAREHADPLERVRVLTSSPSSVPQARSLASVREFDPGTRRAQARALWGALAAGWSWRHTGAAVALAPILTLTYDWLSRPAGVAHGHGPVALLPVGALAALLLAGYLPTGTGDAAPGRRSGRRPGPPCAVSAWVFAVLALFPLASGGPGSIAMAAALLVMGLSQRLLGQLLCRI